MSTAEDRYLQHVLEGDRIDNRGGTYRAKVENDQDQTGLGRVQVRVFAFHGDNSRTPKEVLPWAEVVSMGGGGYDYGSDDTPPVGSWVFVMFEGGHENFPVVIGGVRGKPRFPQEMLTDAGKLPDGQDDPEASWVPPHGQAESAKETYADADPEEHSRTRRVWKKSFKGHTIYIEDGDGKEFLRIVDRAGQMIEMSSPTPKGENAGNIQQRGIRTAERGDQLSQDNIDTGGAHIRILDVAGNEFILDPAKGSERVMVRNTNSGRTKTQEIEMSLAGGKPSIRIAGAEGDAITIEGGGETPIVISDHVGNRITFRENEVEDADGNKIAAGIQIESYGEISSESRAHKTTTRGNIDQLVEGNSDRLTQGNAIETVGNDRSTNVGGNENRSVAGAVVEMISNAPPDIPGDVAHDRLIAAPGRGNDRIQITGLGDIIREIIGVGNFELSTTSGGFSLVSVAPDPTSGAVNAPFKIEMGGAPAPTIIEVNPLGDIVLNTGGAIPAILNLVKATGDHALAAVNSAETLQASKSITALVISINASGAWTLVTPAATIQSPLTSIGLIPTSPVILHNPATLQTLGFVLGPVIEAFIVAGYITAAPGSPLVPVAPGTLGALMDTAITAVLSATCKVSP